MVNPKYSIESTLAMKPVFKRMIQQIDFNIDAINQKLKKEKCHIYMICHRPKISIDIQKTFIESDYIEFCFKVTNNDEVEEHVIKIANNLAIKELKTEYPYTDFELLDERGKNVSGGKVAFFYSEIMKRNNHYHTSFDLKVLYVGQAFGDNGDRVASDRLQSHSTLQKIYSDTIHKNPNHEVWLILWNFEPYLLSAGGRGFVGRSTLGDDATQDHLYKLLTTRINGDQEITLTEAALIRYFQPKYNTEYKTNFPSGTHSSYNQCYSLDVNSVAFELQTRTDLFTRLYSDTIEPEFFHAKHFPLYSEQERADMFKIVLGF
jgi:hypothetical protein